MLPAFKMRYTYCIRYVMRCEIDVSYWNELNLELDRVWDMGVHFPVSTDLIHY